MENKCNLLKKIEKITFQYRATPLVSDQTPVKIYLGRPFRIRLDVLRLVEDAKINFRLHGSENLKLINQW